MATRRVLKLSAIVNYFGDGHKQIERAENILESKNIVRVNYDESTQVISGYVFSTTREKQCKVEVFLDEEREIKKASCSCLQGRATCYHVAAIALFAHYNISENAYCMNALKSRLEQDVDRSNRILATQDFSASRKSARCSEKDLNDLENMDELCLLSSTFADNVLQLVSNIGSLIFSEDFLSAADKKKYFQEKCTVAKSVIADLSELTIGQADNPMWLSYRRFRLLDSHFGSVLRACSKRKFPASLFEKLTGLHNFENSEAVQWRKDHEANAIESFMNLTGLNVLGTGLWLHNCGYLSASPDGLVGDDAVLEIKCPFKFRDALDLQFALTLDTTYICKYVPEENRFVIDENHDYYHQVQGQLHILNRKMCYLIIWTRKQVIILNIEKNPQWAHNIGVLQDFYLNYFLNYIVYGEQC